MASSSTTWLITGASRGIGLEITRQLLQVPTNTVFATCRSPSTATDLQSYRDAPGKLHIVKLDVADEESIKAAAQEVIQTLNGRGLDYVLNNAATMVHGDLAFSFKIEDLMATMTSNVCGPALVSRYLLPAIEASNRRVIVNTSSGLASISSGHGSFSASYSITKIALIMLTYKQACEKPHLIPFNLDPGWVKTKMGGPDAVMEPHESASNIIKLLTGATSEYSGKFYYCDGTEIAL
ncbi:hypothetical protein HYDPIDRAFT_154981 [Hydnomerulius pinastri MD-312]|uniref:NAD(P)-binding protein n=1 Tax=Hydnomerulius pinastri MD-312 TaxID=994086 RepID=A0A0C9W8T4_9AGAM|nr:hypothetical protein HYDPIDRAFT_154981 [Hydnomerulius pinastri MD-312]